MRVRTGALAGSSYPPEIHSGKRETARSMLRSFQRTHRPRNKPPRPLPRRASRTNAGERLRNNPLPCLTEPSAGLTCPLSVQCNLFHKMPKDIGTYRDMELLDGYK